MRTLQEANKIAMASLDADGQHKIMAQMRKDWERGDKYRRAAIEEMFPQIIYYGEKK